MKNDDHPYREGTSARYEHEILKRDAVIAYLVAEQDAAWFAIEHGWDIEPRAFFERDAPTNGFKYPLAQAVHHMWKRRVRERIEQPASVGAVDPQLGVVDDGPRA